MLRFRLRLLSYPRSQFLHTDRGLCHLLRAFPRSRSLDQPGPLARRGSPPVAAPLQASVPPRYRRFFALPGPAVALWPAVPVAGAYLAPGCFSPGPGGLHQFQRYPSLRAAVVPPPEPDAAINQRSSAPDAAFAVHRAARLPDPIRIEDCTTFDACGPQRRSPASPPVLSGGTAPGFRHSNASPQLHGSLAVTVSRFSLAGLHRLPSGHADEPKLVLLAKARLLERAPPHRSVGPVERTLGAVLLDPVALDVSQVHRGGLRAVGGQPHDARLDDNAARVGPMGFRTQRARRRAPPHAPVERDPGQDLVEK